MQAGLERDALVVAVLDGIERKQLAVFVPAERLRGVSPRVEWHAIREDGRGGGGRRGRVYVGADRRLAAGGRASPLHGLGDEIFFATRVPLRLASCTLVVGALLGRDPNSPLGYGLTGSLHLFFGCRETSYQRQGEAVGEKESEIEKIGEG